MATAKRDLTNPRVQGPRPAKDPLDKLVAIAIRVAVREGLLGEPASESKTEELGADDRVEQGSDDRRSA